MILILPSTRCGFPHRHFRHGGNFYDISMVFDKDLIETPTRKVCPYDLEQMFKSLWDAQVRKYVSPPDRLGDKYVLEWG